MIITDAGHNIKKAREFRGYSQEWMADQLNMGQSNYSKLEQKKNKIPLDQLMKIAEVLEMNLKTLLTFGEKAICSIETQNNDNQSGNFVNNYFSNEMKEVYENQVKQMKELFEAQLKNYKEEIQFLREMLTAKN